jgi:hypothetical protein
MFMAADEGDRDIKKIDYSDYQEMEGEPVNKNKLFLITDMGDRPPHLVEYSSYLEEEGSHPDY